MIIEFEEGFTESYRVIDKNTGLVMNGITSYDTETKEVTYNVVSDVGKECINGQEISYKEIVGMSRRIPNSILINIDTGKRIK